MAVVLGLSPFEGTRFSVYNEKTGKKPVEPMEDKTRVIFDSGHFLENMVANLFDYRSGYETYEVKAMFEHPRHPYLRGNIDRFYRRHGEKAPLADLDLAYAISIHKAQGSEYNQIIIPVLTAFSIMLKRNLIYTGITRAKKKVVLVGHKRALAQAIRTNVIATRNTQLGRRIIAKLNTQTEE